MTFVSDHWGDLASVVGLAVTVFAALRAQAAAQAAREVKRQLSNLDALAEISAAITILEEIKRLQRKAAWDDVLDRYGTVRRHLVRVEQIHLNVTEAQRKEILEAVRQFGIIETKIERIRANPEGRAVDVPRINGIIAKQADSLEQILIAIKQGGV